MGRRIESGDIAERLKAARLAHKSSPSVSHIAKIAGVHRNTYAEWENKKDGIPNALIAVKLICQHLGVSPTYIISGDQDWSIDVAPQHKERVKAFYNRYLKEEGFNLLIRLLLEMDEDTVKNLTEFILSIKEKA